MINIPEKDYERLLDKASKSDELAFQLHQYKSALAQVEQQIIAMSDKRIIDDS